MHASGSQSDVGSLERGGHSGVPPPRSREQKRGGGAGFKILPIEHPNWNDDFPARGGFTSEKGGTTDDTFDWKGFRNGGWQLLLEHIFPCVGWARCYRWEEYLKADVVAGLTVGTMLVPQAMSYSKLAGLHPIYGLYSSFMPILTYAVFGSSRQLGVGPVAMVSLLVSNALQSILGTSQNEGGGQQEESQTTYVELAIQLAFLVGVIECLMGLVRLGWLIRFISHSVVSGFTTASAIIIGLSQANSVLGYDITRSSKLLTIVHSIIDGSDGFMWQPLVMSCVSLALLLVMKELGKKYKRFVYMRAAGPVTAIVLGLAFIKIFRPSSIKLVGTVPQGFPTFSIRFNFAHFKDLLPHAFLVSGVGILESVGIAKTLAARNGYEIDSNQELFGLGMCNLVGSAFSASPVAGSFSRSAVQNESGAKTGMSGIVVFLVIGGALLFLTSLFRDIPQCALAAVVISAVLGLLDYDEAIYLWRVQKRDLLLWMATFLFTLFFGIEVGVLVGVGISLVFVIYESANPHTAILGRLPGTTVYRNIEQYPDVYSYYGIVIVRVDAPVYFANISVIKDRLSSCEHLGNPLNSRRRGAPVDRVSYIVFDMSPVTYIDSTAVHAIIELYHNCNSRSVQLAFCNPNRRVMTTLARAKVPDLVGREWYFVRVHDAVLTCMSHSQANTAKRGSPNEDSPEGSSVYVHDARTDSAISSRGLSWPSEDSENRALLSNV